MLAIAEAPTRCHPAPIAAPPGHAALRAVAPMRFADLAPADLAGQDAPSWDVVDPAELLVDEAYQRDLSPKSLALIRRIVARWSWAKFKPPVCARVDGALHVLDGQHTAIAAASHGGVPVIPVLVVPAPEVADRAAAFVSHAVDRVQARPAQVWHAAVAAGDEDAMTVAQVLDRAGVTMLPYAPASDGYRPGETIALGGVQKLVERRGAMRARELLEIVARAELAPITADHLRIAEALVHGVDYAGKITAEQITAALRDVTPKQLADAKALAHSGRMPAWRALAAVLFRANSAPKRGRGKAASATSPATDRGAGAHAADIAEDPEPATSEVPAAPMPTGPVEPPARSRASGIDDVPMAALVSGIQAWRRGGAWRLAWGPPPGTPGCAVPGALLGDEAMIAGTRRREAVIEHVCALWRLHQAWPAAGWGARPDGSECAMPSRFLDPSVDA